MTPRDIINKVRIAVKDVNEARYSDYDMIDALNTVLNLTYNELASFSNDVLVKTENIRLTGGEGELPEDFLQVVEVYHGDTVYMPQTKGYIVSPYTYTILGNSIYSNASSLTVDYKPDFEDLTVEDLDDDLELPNYMKEYLKRMVMMALSGSLEASEGLSQLRQQVREISSNRGYSRLQFKGVWSEAI